MRARTPATLGGTLLVVVVAVALLSGCGSPTTTTSTAPPSSTTTTGGTHIVTTITHLHPSTTAPPSTTTTTAPSTTTTTRGPQTFTVDETASGSTIRGRIGDTLKVNLKGNPSTGYQWDMRPFIDPWEVLRPQGEPAYQGSTEVGGGGTYTFTFKVVGKGADVLHMEYKEPGDQGLVSKTFELTFVSDYVQVDQSMAGSTVNVPFGYDLGVVLDGNPSTGYTWKIDDYDGTVVRQSGSPWFGPLSGAPGAPGNYIYRFNTTGRGQTTLSFRYVPAGGGDPAKTFSVTIRVQ